jgi:hypothetical protein
MPLPRVAPASSDGLTLAFHLQSAKRTGSLPIERIAAKYFPPSDAAIVVAGDASKIANSVGKFGKVTIEKAK